MTLGSVPRSDPGSVTRVGDRAVVVGGSIAGLCAARVLAAAFDEVVVLERDPLPDAPVARDGAPQTSHPHALLEAGRATLEDLFPGFGEDVLASGGLLVDAGTDMAYYDQGGFLADTDARLPTYCASRALFEQVVRQHVRRLDAVSLRGDRHVAGYRTNADATAVTGVTVRDETGTQEPVPADLVVDATGRSSVTPAWLDDHGYDAPPTDRIRVDVTYSTIEVERPPDDRRIVFVPPSAPRTRGGACIPIEDDRWQVIVQGMHGDDPPTDPAAFREAVDGLPVDELATIVREQPWAADSIDQYPFPSSVRRRYERLDAFPDDLVVVGDAIASFNPVYGQGMSVAALEAVLLGHELANGGLAELPGRFFDRTAGVVDTVWKMAAGADFAFPRTTGPEPSGLTVLDRYVDRLLRRAHADPVLSEAFLRVLRLEEPPSTLFRPRLAWRTVRPAGVTEPLASLAPSPSP